jgi:hypothetical protein
MEVIRGGTFSKEVQQAIQRCAIIATDTVFTKSVRIAPQNVFETLQLLPTMLVIPTQINTRSLANQFKQIQNGWFAHLKPSYRIMVSAARTRAEQGVLYHRTWLA